MKNLSNTSTNNSMNDKYNTMKNMAIASNPNMELRQLLSSSKLELGQVAAFCTTLKINLNLSFLGEKTEVKGLLETLGDASYPILDEADNRRVFVDAVAKEFNSIAKHTFSSQKTYKEILDNACKILKVKKEVYSKPNLSYQEQELIIINAIFKKMVAKLKKKKTDVEFNAELEAILEENKVDYKKYVGDKRIIDALLASTTSGVLSVIVANLVIGQMIKDLSLWGTIKLSAGWITLPFFPILGTSFSILAALSVIYTLCGTSYKKLIPTIVLIATLREENSTKLLNAA